MAPMNAQQISNGDLTNWFINHFRQTYEEADAETKGEFRECMDSPMVMKESHYAGDYLGELLHEDAPAVLPPEWEQWLDRVDWENVYADYRQRVDMDAE